MHKTSWWKVGLFLLASLPAAALAEVLFVNPEPTNGTTPFNVNLATVRGGQLTAADFQGKVVVINFWASWCPPCLEELPALVRINGALANRGVTIVGINYLDRLDGNGIRSFIQEHGINFPILDARHPSILSFIQSLGGVRGLPTNVIIDRTGRISYNRAGPLDENGYMSLIQPLL